MMKTSFYHFILFCSFMCFGVFWFSPAQAQNEELQSADTIEEHKYVELNIRNLMRIYWVLRDMELDSKTIDQYLMLTECDIYSEYYRNDIKWHKIRQATRDYLEESKKDFPTKIHFVIPVYFERYSLDEKHFQLEKNSVFKSAYEISINAKPPFQQTYCEDLDFRELGEDYPLKIILSLNSPFTLSKIKMSPQKAEWLITEAFHEEERKAYLKFYVTLNEFRGYGEGKVAKHGFINADIEKIELYTGPELIDKVIDVDARPDQAGVMRESFK